MSEDSKESQVDLTINESQVDLAIEDFTEAIRLKRQLIESVPEDPVREKRLKKELARTYVYRGTARYWKKNDSDNAITDIPMQ